MTLMENDGDREAKRAVGERSEAVAGRAAPVGVPDPELVERPPRTRRADGGVRAAARGCRAARRPRCQNDGAAGGRGASWHPGVRLERQPPEFIRGHARSPRRHRPSSACLAPEIVPGGLTGRSFETNALLSAQVRFFRDAGRRSSDRLPRSTIGRSTNRAMFHEKSSGSPGRLWGFTLRAHPSWASIASTTPWALARRSTTSAMVIERRPRP